MEPEKPWSIAQFELYRKYNTDFCKQYVIPYLDDNDIKHILFKAPVKSGKREFAEYLALRDHSDIPVWKHIFISAWHRTTDESQRTELKHHNLDVFSINTLQNTEKCLAKLQEYLHKNIKLKIHMDECDYGAGATQLLSRIWIRIRNDTNIKVILYSATPQEALFSQEFREITDNDDYLNMIDTFLNNAVFIEYIPPSDIFCGPKKFIENGLVFNAHPFFKIDNLKKTMYLSPQAKYIITGLQSQMQHPSQSHAKRNIILLRLSNIITGIDKSKSKTEKKEIYKFLQNIELFPELAEFLIIFDKTDSDISDIQLHSRITPEKVRWSDVYYWKKLTTNMPILIVYDQTCSRSTELCCHDRVYATHDYRNTITYSVISQAQERTNHYSIKYGGFQPIKIYGHRPTFLLSAGLISYTKYLMPAKYEIRIFNKKFNIINMETKTVEFVYNKCEDVEYKLLDLESYITPSISNRMTSTVREVLDIDIGFIECNLETYNTVVRPVIRAKIGPDYNFMNPFLTAQNRKNGDIWLGYLREFKQLTYDEIKDNSRWGLCGKDSPCMRQYICYDANGKLGIAYCIPSGTKSVTTLKTFNSQYSST